ncbi:MAG: CHAP domain-containing protein [Paracoccaceae bacterium]
MAAPEGSIDVTRSTMAVEEAHAKRARGERVWCVPFARTMSGIEIRGNAETWWAGAKGVYDRGHEPRVGSVMVFTGTRKLSMGHVAVVSEIVSDREIKIDHANWKRNKVSMGMSVIDVSDRGDWSAVKVESQPGSYGRVYPISGFVYPKAKANPTLMAQATIAPADPLDAALTEGMLVVSTSGRD